MFSAKIVLDSVKNIVKNCELDIFVALCVVLAACLHACSAVLRIDRDGLKILSLVVLHA